MYIWRTRGGRGKQGLESLGNLRRCKTFCVKYCLSPFCLFVKLSRVWKTGSKKAIWYEAPPPLCTSIFILENSFPKLGWERGGGREEGDGSLSGTSDATVIWQLNRTISRDFLSFFGIKNSTWSSSKHSQNCSWNFPLRNDLLEKHVSV